jgi:hypothetical protein
MAKEQKAKSFDSNPSFLKSSERKTRTYIRHIGNISMDKIPAASNTFIFVEVAGAGLNSNQFIEDLKRLANILT